MTSPTAASAVRTSPTTSDFRDGFFTTIPPSRTAAIGAIRVARTAGQTDAARVTSVPVSIATTAVRVAKTMLACGRSSPTARISAVSPFAIRTPNASPTAEATMPRIAPSRMTERNTCRREAPSVRSVASSFVRCATVIESVLKITKAPTKSAIPPNASRK